MQFIAETQTSLSRRRLLTGLGAGAAGALLLAACGATRTATQAPATGVASVYVPNEPLAYHLQILPNTPVSNLLRQRMEEFYTGPYTKRIQRGATGIDIYSATLDYVQNNTRDLYEGKSRMIKTYQGMVQGIPVAPATIAYEVPTYLNEVERQRLRDQHSLSNDGNFGVSFTYSTNIEIASGLAPHIEVSFPTKPDKALISFIAVKEALSLLIMDLVIERIAQQLQKNGTNSTIDIRTANGQTKSIETVTTAFAEVYSKATRIVTIIDLGALALLVSEFSKVNSSTSIMTNHLAKLVLPKINGYDFGTTPSQIYDRTAEWTVRNALPATYWAAKPGEPAFYQGTVVQLP